MAGGRDVAFFNGTGEFEASQELSLPQTMSRALYFNTADSPETPTNRSVSCMWVILRTNCIVWIFQVPNNGDLVYLMPSSSLIIRKLACTQAKSRPGP